MRYVLFIGFMILSLSAAAAEPTPDQRKIVEIALRWIETHSDYKEIHPPQQLILVDPAEMTAEAAKRKASPTSSAMYDCRTQTVIMRSDSDFTRVVVQSTVLHELVHHAQCLERRFRGDLCAQEQEAYGLQVAWLKSLAPQYASEDDRQWVLRYAATREVEAEKACDYWRKR